MKVLRDGCRWSVQTADTVYQRVAFKCLVIAVLPLTSGFLLFGALFDQRRGKRYLLPSSLCVCFLLQCCVYELLPCTQCHEPAANIICLIHVINSQRASRASKSGDKGGGLLWGDKNESAHYLICHKPIFRQVSWLKGKGSGMYICIDLKEKTALLLYYIEWYLWDFAH